MKSTKVGLLTAVVVWLVTIPTFAHHAFEAEFDSKRDVTVTGVLTRVEWVNPHIYVYMDVKDGSGKVMNVKFETVPPLMMRKGGFEKSLLVIGETYTLDGYGAKDGSPDIAWLKTVHFPDGRAIDIIRDENKGK